MHRWAEQTRQPGGLGGKEEGPVGGPWQPGGLGGGRGEGVRGERRTHWGVGARKGASCSSGELVREGRGEKS